MSHNRISLIGLAMLVVSLPLARANDDPASQPAKVRPVDFHKLKELMPDELVGVKRSSHEGENQTIGEMSMSNAKADYMKPNSDGSDAHATIQIMDYGA